MKNLHFPTFVLAAALFGARVAAAPVMMTASTPPKEPVPGSFVKADAAIVEAFGALKTLQDCTKITVTLRADLKKTQTELKAEFATVPPEFNSLLLRKSKRVDRQELTCLQMTPQPGLLFTKAHDLLRNIEPKNTPGIIARFKKVEAGRAQYNRLIEIPKATPK